MNEQLKFVWTDPATGESLTKEQFENRFWRQLVLMTPWKVNNPITIQNRTRRIFNRLPRSEQKKVIQKLSLERARQLIALRSNKPSTSNLETIK